MKRDASHARSSRRVGARERLVDELRDQLVGVALAGLLVVVVLNNASGSPGWLTSGVQALLYVAFAAVVVALRAPEADDWRITGLQVFLTGVLFGVVVRQRAGGVPPGNRAIEIAALLVLFVGYPFVRHDGVRRVVRAAPFVVAAGAVVGAHLYHAVGLPPGSALASFPVFVGLMLSLNLFFVPQYVSREWFFRATSLVAAAVVAAGLATYLVGPYRLFGFHVQQAPGSLSLPLVGASLPVLRSVFVNPNALGLLAFPGTVAALVETVETYDPGGSDGPGESLRRSVVPGTLLVVNALGLALSFSRAAWLAAALAVGLYGASLVRGRSVVPWAAAGLACVTALFLAVLWAGLVPVGSGDRFALWAGALEAYLASPTVLGEGIVVPSELMRPFVAAEYAGDGPHNSYLMILLRAGLVGLLGYLALTVGSVVLGLVEHRDVDVPVLALSFGWLVHQLFEGYTLFQYTTGAVLAALAFGYLIADLRLPSRSDRREEDPSGTDRRKGGSSLQDTFGNR